MMSKITTHNLTNSIWPDNTLLLSNPLYCIVLEYSNSTISLIHALVMAILILFHNCYSSYIHYLAFVTTDWCECIPTCSIPMPMYNNYGGVLVWQTPIMWKNSSL